MYSVRCRVKYNFIILLNRKKIMLHHTKFQGENLTLLLLELGEL